MRQPTPDHVLYEWHRRALVEDRLPRQEDAPQCGWYRTRLVKGGPWVPVLIWCHRVYDEDTGELDEPESLRATIGAEPADPVRVWLHCRPISQNAYQRIIDEAASPTMAATRVRVDLAQSPTLPSPRR